MRLDHCSETRTRTRELPSAPEGNTRRSGDSGGGGGTEWNFLFLRTIRLLTSKGRQHGMSLVTLFVCSHLLTRPYSCHLPLTSPLFLGPLMLLANLVPEQLRPSVTSGSHSLVTILALNFQGPVRSIKNIKGCSH
jgi:hypothetical protein